MRSIQCAWWGVILALLLVLPSDARPSPDSEPDSESWQPIAPIHRVARYSTGLTPNYVELNRPAKPNILSFKECLQEIKFMIKMNITNVLPCANYKFRKDMVRSNNLSVNPNVKDGLNDLRELNDTLQVLLDTDNNRESGAKNTSVSRKEPLTAFKDHHSLLGQTKNGSEAPRRSWRTGALQQRRGRRSAMTPRRIDVKPSIVRDQEVPDEDHKWLPVALSPPERGEGLDIQSNSITQDLVNDFVSNSLPDLKIPQEKPGTVVQVVSPSYPEESDPKWESVSLDDLILSHTTEPVHQHKHTWHKRPTVILVQDTPDDLLPKPPSHHYHHVSPKPVHHFSTPSPEPFPRPTYHYPRPSPEPPPKPSYPTAKPEPSYHYPTAKPEPSYHYPTAKPEPSYHYPTAKPEPSYHYPTAEPEPSQKPAYHYKPYKPIHNHYPQPHFPYTTVIVHTLSSIHPESNPEPEPSPEPPWVSHYPSPDPEPEPESDPYPEPEDPDPEPEIIVSNNDPVPEPPSQDIPSYDDEPGPPPVYIMNSPISPGSPTNPVTISSGKPPPSIVILASPEDSPPGSPPLADPIYPGGGGGGAGGGLVPIVPIVPPPIAVGGLGSGAGSGGGIGGGSDCPAVQVFNYQSVTNSLENKDCVINLNAPIQNSNGGDSQIEVPNVQADVPYDDVPESSTVATTTKKPSSGSMSVLDYLSSFFTSMTIFNPISISFWSFLFAPISILLASGLAVGALILPWFFPSYWFGRRIADDNRRVGYVGNPYRLRESALRFERSINSGMSLDDFLGSIGLLR